MSKTSSNKRRKAQARRRRALAWIASILCTVVALSLCVMVLTNRSDVNAQPSDIVDDGLLRVHLRTLSNTPALGLTLDGVYTVDGDAGFRFTRGTEVTVAEGGGELYLSAGGLTIDMGSSFTLKRHAPEDGKEPGGIYIHESEKDNLFAGDLKLSSNGSGGIESILTIQVEDYLYGVVAYEMSNSFPLEALKAQAIAARTYAMRARAANKTKAYDVVDTTADQVFKGFDPALTNVIKAVDSTRGIVGMASGSFAQCYYTASNGGQIASTKQIWGGTVSYIEMKDDPYDLENSLSTQKSAFIPAKIEQGTDLERALAAQLDLIIPDAQEIRIDSVVSVTPTDPDVKGSLMYRAMDFEVTASKRVLMQTLADEPTTAPDETAPEETAQPEADETASPAPETPTPSAAPTPGPDGANEPDALLSPEPSVSPEPTQAWMLSDFVPCEQTYVVRLETYGYLKNLLNLNINSQDFEVFSVENEKDGFRIISRRFGHGVGMSQRGAQTMAGKHHKDCEEILSFYYPGVSWYQIDWTENTLSPISELPSSLGYARARPTPRPTQAPLPPLKEGQKYARVTATTLNVRSKPSTSGSITALLYSGERVIVTGYYDDNWVSIKTVEFEGYVKADYLKDD